MSQPASKRLAGAISLGFLATAAVALVAYHPLFTLAAAAGAAYLGHQVASRVRLPRTPVGDVAAVYVVWLLYLVIPFVAAGVFVYVFARAGREFGEWKVLGVAFALSSVAAYLYQGHLEDKSSKEQRRP